MYTNEKSFPWHHKQGECADRDGGILGEQSGPIVALSDDEVEVLAETLEALRGHEPTEREIDYRCDLQIATQLCRAAAKLSRSIDLGLLPCERLLLSLLKDYGSGDLLDQEAEVAIMVFKQEVEMLAEISNKAETLKPEQLKKLLAAVEEETKVVEVSA